MRTTHTLNVHKSTPTWDERELRALANQAAAYVFNDDDDAPKKSMTLTKAYRQVQTICDEFSYSRLIKKAVLFENATQLTTIYQLDTATTLAYLRASIYNSMQYYREHICGVSSEQDQQWYKTANATVLPFILDMCAPYVFELNMNLTERWGYAMSARFGTAPRTRDVLCRLYNARCKLGIREVLRAGTELGNALVTLRARDGWDSVTACAADGAAATGAAAGAAADGAGVADLIMKFREMASVARLAFSVEKPWADCVRLE